MEDELSLSRESDSMIEGLICNESSPISLKKLKQLVKLEYRKISTSFHVQKSHDIKEILHKNRCLINERASKSFFQRKPAQIADFDLPVEDEDSNVTCTRGVTIENEECVVKNGVGGQVQRSVIYLIRTSSRLPVMFSWNSLQQNYAVEDENVLTNIPYLDSKDTSFLEDLLDHYERGVHGNREDGAGFLNDQMFFDLCNRLTTYVVQTNENPDIASASSIFPPDIVFEAIGQVFIDKGNTHELKAKYGDILLKQDKKLNKSLHQSGSTFEEHFSNPDIEGKDAVSATAEQSLHSFTSLFCRRCYKYDCYLHPYGSVNPDLYPRKNDLKVEGPCGPQCSLWFVVTAKNSKLKKSSSCENLAVSNTPADLSPSPSFSSLSAATNSDCDSIRIPCRRGIHASTSNENGHKGDNNNNNNSEEKTYWSPADQSMFRVYASVFGDNCCAIAASLGDKSCKEVHDFALKDELCQKIAKRKSNEQNRVKSKRLTHRDWMRKYSKVAALKDIDGALKVNTTSSYVPCSHEGVCSEQKNCACIERSTFCEKFCQCPQDCPNRFPGCRCKAHCDTKQCPCFLAVRECDPDLCPSCGAADFASLNDAVASSSSSEDLAPSTPYSSDKPRCNNVNIQRGLKKRLLLAPSQVAGWGIYLKEAVEKNTFIAEYCGELISQDEAERRGKVYDRHMCSFLFNLNQDLVVDATRKGNKIRFANHSVNPNCVAKVMMVNGDHRIGIFSRCAIAEDEELFFDYRYGPLEQLKFVGIEHKRKPAQKSTVG